MYELVGFLANYVNFTLHKTFVISHVTEGVFKILTGRKELDALSDTECKCAIVLK